MDEELMKRVNEVLDWIEYFNLSAAVREGFLAGVLFANGKDIYKIRQILLQNENDCRASYSVSEWEMKFPTKQKNSESKVNNVNENIVYKYGENSDNFDKNQTKFRHNNFSETNQNTPTAQHPKRCFNIFNLIRRIFFKKSLTKKEVRL